jgi:hypothetical protein
MAVPDTQYVLSLAQQIENAKTNLRQLEEKWTSLFAGVPSPAEAPLKKGGRKPDPDGNSAKVIAAINSAPNETWSADRVQRKTGLARKQVEKCLYNLCAANKIRRAGRGLYASSAFPTGQLPLDDGRAVVN